MAASVPNSFIAGTLARAEEVNENFQAIRDYVNALTTATLQIPTGAIFGSGFASVPIGWLACDGAEVSRAEQDALFAIIGTSYGAGNGSTTFNLPDLRGRVPASSGPAAGMQRGKAEGGGSGLPVASRQVGHTHSRGTIAMATSVPIGTATVAAHPGGSGFAVGVATNVHGHTIAVSGDAGPNGPAYQIIKYIIRT